MLKSKTKPKTQISAQRKREEISKSLSRLPESFLEQILEYISLLKKQIESEKVDEYGFKFEWEGGLSEMREQFSSVELQHKASEWR